MACAIPSAMGAEVTRRGSSWISSRRAVRLAGEKATNSSLR